MGSWLRCGSRWWWMVMDEEEGVGGGRAEGRHEKRRFAFEVGWLGHCMDSVVGSVGRAAPFATFAEQRPRVCDHTGNLYAARDLVARAPIKARRASRGCKRVRSSVCCAVLARVLVLVLVQRAGCAALCLLRVRSQVPSSQAAKVMEMARVQTRPSCVGLAVKSQSASRFPPLLPL